MKLMRTKLTPNRNRLRAAALTFLCGLTLSWALKPAAPEQPPPAQYAMTKDSEASQVFAPSPAPLPPAPAVPYLDWSQSPRGEGWKNRHNGRPLRLHYDDLGAEELGEAKVLPLSSGRVLAAAGDTLYLLAAGGQKLWEHREPQPIIDFDYVAATELVYVTAGDNNLFILEARTGRERHRLARNGRAGFGQTVAYGKDMCLVMNNNSGYRAGEDFMPPMSDGVSAWRGTTMLWHRDVPPDAELHVSGSRIFAVTRTSSRVLVAEIKPPASGILGRGRP